MNIEIDKQEKTTNVRFIGRLDTPSSLEASKALEPVLQDASGRIILDCSELEYISSSGLRIFLTIRKAAAAQGGEVVVKGIRNDIRTVFMMTGFLNLFKILLIKENFVFLKRNLRLIIPHFFLTLCNREKQLTPTILLYIKIVDPLSRLHRFGKNDF